MGQTASTNTPVKEFSTLLQTNPDALYHVEDVELKNKQKQLPQLLQQSHLQLDRFQFNDSFKFNHIQQIHVPLASINLSYNYFTTIPITIPSNTTTLVLFDTIHYTHFSTITCLNLSANQISQLHSQLFDSLPWLMELNISNNHLITLDDAFFTHLSHTSIQKLNISNNKLHSISSLISKLTLLTELDMSFHYLSSENLNLLSQSISQLLQLKTLIHHTYPHGYHINIHTTTTTAHDQFFTSHLQLEQVTWKHAQLAMSNALFDYPCITRLNLQFNRLHGSISIAQCTQLQYLNISHNKLSMIYGMEHCKQLHCLYLRNNEFTCIDFLPSNQLIELDISFNPIKECDVYDFSQWNQLQRLNCYQCQHMMEHKVKLPMNHSIELYIPSHTFHKTFLSTTTCTTITTTNDRDDKILGVIMGQCLGDAMGLSTEFLSHEQVYNMYGCESIDLFHFFKDSHRRWNNGDYTDDTDQFLCIMDMLLYDDDSNNILYFCNRLFRWIIHGNPMHGDDGGLGIGQTIKSVVLEESFLKTPHRASEKIWNQHGQQLRSNGAIMRTSILACYYLDTKSVIDPTIQIAKCTHFDPLCIASCIVITTLITQCYTLLDNTTTTTSHLMEQLIQQSVQYALEYLKKNSNNTNYEKELYLYCFEKKSFVELELDNTQSGIGYTLKCMACALIAVREYVQQHKSIAIIIQDLIWCGGDADTNACVALSVLGSIIGWKQLQLEFNWQWKQMEHGEYVLHKAKELLQNIKKK